MEAVIPQLSKFYGWQPQAGWELTGSEIRAWVDAANRMIEAKAGGGNG